LPYVLEPMRLGDVPAVAAIEREVFPLPWTASAFAYEVQANPHSYYLVARHRRQEPAPTEGRLTAALLRLRTRTKSTDVLGYGGFWLMVDEAHISTIAVRLDHRRRGLGHLLLIGLVDWACEVKASVITLEVRPSNTAARSLYRMYGFQPVGRRKGYYSDNGEDALIMTTEAITSPSFQSNLSDLKARLRARLSSSQGVGLAR